MTVEYLVQIMNRSIQKVEATVDQMERHSNMSKTDQHQIMQAVLELSDRIKILELQVDKNKQEKIH